MAKEELSARYKSKRSSILVLVTALVVVVFVVFGLVTALLFRSSQNRLIEKSVDRLLETEAENLASATNYIAQLLFPLFEEKIGEATTEELIDALLNEKLTEGQEFVIDEMSGMIEEGLLGIDTAIIVMLPSAFNPKPLVIAASEKALIYDWEIPDYVIQAVDEEKSYIWKEEGVPELDLSGEHLLIINKGFSAESGVEIGYVFTKPMQEEIAEINSFYDQERRNTSLLLWLTTIISIVVVILITFFVLSYLIRKRITLPIEELAAAAEEVMEGNLDVEVEIHEGGDFEGLERAFKEMVESLRRTIARSVGEE